MTATFIISRPPVLSKLFRNSKTRGRAKTERYMQWRNCAGWELKEFRPTVFHCPVRVRIDVQRSITQKGEWFLNEGDGDNLVKAILDLLVINRVLLDDNSEHVYGHSMDWVDDSALGPRKVRVTVVPVAVEDRRAA